MKLLSHRKHRVAAVVTAAAVAVGGGSAAILAATSPASAGTASLAAATAPMRVTTAVKAAGAAGRHDRSLLARSDHATIELRVKGHWVTFDLDRGKVTAVSSGAITLLRPDGDSVTLKIDAATRFGGVASASAVHTGDRATVVSEGGTARRVAQHLRKAPAGSAATPSTTSVAA
jgi:hypothetical protein